MPHTTKLISGTTATIESAVKTYLDAQSITTWRGMAAFTIGSTIYVLIDFE